MIRLDDVGVDEVRYQFSFADEVLDEPLLVGIGLANDFDRNSLDEILRAVLLGLIYDTHAALENFPHDIVPKLVLDAKEWHYAMFVYQESMSSRR
jgi:hypothetical protein